MPITFVRQKGKTFKYHHLKHGGRFRILTEPWRYESHEIMVDGYIHIHHAIAGSENSRVRYIFIVESLDKESLCYLDLSALETEIIKSTISANNVNDVYRMIFRLDHIKYPDEGKLKYLSHPVLLPERVMKKSLQKEQALIEYTEYLSVLEYHPQRM